MSVKADTSLMDQVHLVQLTFWKESRLFMTDQSNTLWTRLSVATSKENNDVSDSFAALKQIEIYALTVMKLQDTKPAVSS